MAYRQGVRQGSKNEDGTLSKTSVADAQSIIKTEVVPLNPLASKAKTEAPLQRPTINLIEDTSNYQPESPQTIYRGAATPRPSQGLDQVGQVQAALATITEWMQ